MQLRLAILWVTGFTPHSVGWLSRLELIWRANVRRNPVQLGGLELIRRSNIGSTSHLWLSYISGNKSQEISPSDFN